MGGVRINRFGELRVDGLIDTIFRMRYETSSPANLELKVIPA